jgi:hypothetical protein
MNSRSETLDMALGRLLQRDGREVNKRIDFVREGAEYRR